MRRTLFYDRLVFHNTNNKSNDKQDGKYDEQSPLAVLFSEFESDPDETDKSKHVHPDRLTFRPRDIGSPRRRRSICYSPRESTFFRIQMQRYETPYDR